MKTKRDLKRYLQPKFGPLSIGIVWLAAGIAGMVALDGEIIALAIGVLFAALAAGPLLLKLIRLNKQIKELEEAGKLSYVLEDFFIADSYVNDYIRMGDTYIFGRMTGTMVRYDEIKKAFQYVHKRNFSESSRGIKVRIKGHRTLELTKLPTRGKGNADLEKIMAKIASVNPKAKLITEVKDGQ